MSPEKTSKHGSQPKFSFLPVVALGSLAISAPVFEKLRGGAEFFVAKRSQPFDIAAFVVLLAIVPPAIPIVVEVVLRMLSFTLSRSWHLLVHLLLTLLVLLLIVPRLYGNGGFEIVVASFLGALTLTYTYAKFTGYRLFLCVLSLTALITPLIFVMNPSIQTLLFNGDPVISPASGGRSIPVVMIVFDEMPLSALLAGDREIDQRRFPNFSALAKTASWFRNATSVSEHTTLAIPAILTGNLPSKIRRFPVAAVHPQNLFTLLGESHDLHVEESATSLCPVSLCGRQQAPYSFIERLIGLMKDIAAVYARMIVPSRIDLGLPEITMGWGNFWEDSKSPQLEGDRGGRALAVHRFIGEIHRDRKPGLYFLAAPLPHMRYQYYPSGRIYIAPYKPRAYSNRKWANDDWGITQGYQQFLMQVGTCDTLLGELISKLREENIFDSSLFIVTADHGASFREGSHIRGNPEDDTFYEDIMSVPLFIKFPGQVSGEISDESVESIDILPSIASVLAMELKNPVDGAPLQDRQQNGLQKDKKFVTGLRRRDDKGGVITEELSVFSFPNPSGTYPSDSLRWKLSRFPVDSISFAPNILPGMIGRKVADLNVRPSPCHSSIQYPSTRQEHRLPGLFTLKICDSTPFPSVGVLAVNGTVAAASRTYDLNNSRYVDFILPEEILGTSPDSAEILILKQGEEGQPEAFESLTIGDL